MTDCGRSYLAGGHVFCALRHADVGIDECLGCLSLKELNERTRVV